ncbi:MAG TPA: sigma-70 family RNA polymerase sigma factor [Bacillota bacterium]|jgi:RNA polymerase sigma-70 factor (ECF subfamily)|nr:sigma-70 family RNA polymerase sigma factor [Bacillota bacterium]HOI37276.1 sigma-70 family RNA polymerase sigma factor [Bacillota bacterium]
MYSDASDEQLIQLHLSGDPRGMEAIYERYFDRIYRFAYSRLRSAQDAEDVTSAIFLKLCKSLDSFRGEAKFSTWIYTVANNAVMDSVRRRRPSVSLDADLRIDGDDSVPREIEDDAPGPDDRVADADFARYVYSKLDVLPPAQRSVIELRFFMELSYQQIADQLGVELGTVKSRLNRAIAALRSLVSTEEEVKASAFR